MVHRCAWADNDPLMRAYHDEEWGVPQRDPRMLWEMLMLEGFQAGLSWSIILRKRVAFRKAFAKFDPKKVARFGARDVKRLMADAGIVRHAGKIASTINNAQRVPELREEFGSLARYAWRYEDQVEKRPRRITLAALRALPPSPVAAAMSKDLKKRGWSFVGPTTVYAFMQAMGLVNDHIEGCHARAKALAARAGFRRPT